MNPFTGHVIAIGCIVIFFIVVSTKIFGFLPIGSSDFVVEVLCDRYEVQSSIFCFTGCDDGLMLFFVEPLELLELIEKIHYTNVSRNLEYI